MVLPVIGDTKSGSDDFQEWEGPVSPCYNGSGDICVDLRILYNSSMYFFISLVPLAHHYIYFNTLTHLPNEICITVLKIVKEVVIGIMSGLGNVTVGGR